MRILRNSGNVLDDADRRDDASYQVYCAALRFVCALGLSGSGRLCL